jgi:TonB family protein
MSYTSFPRPTSGPLAVPLIFPPHSLVDAAPDLSPSDAEAVLAKLHDAISADASELGAILQATVEAAQVLTGAGSAALALRCDGMVICRARSGEPAPELGVRLDEDSGISGECLRQGQMLRCEDAHYDHRVNPLVCRTLGLRSIAIAPLRRHGSETIGILEIFSTRPYAFNEVHMQLLSRLAELAEMAQTQDENKQDEIKLMPTTASSLAVEPEVALPSFAPAPAVETSAYDEVGPSLRDPLSAARSLGRLYEPAKRRLPVIGIVAAALALVLLVGWRFLDYTPEPVAHRSAAREPQLTSAEAPAAEETARQAPTARRPNPGHPLERSKRTSGTANRHAAETVSVPDVVTHPDLSSETTSKTTSAEDSSPAAASPAMAASSVITVVRRPRREHAKGEENTAEPRPLETALAVASAGDGAPLDNLLDSPAGLPKLNARVSQGAIGAVLEHRVQPVYPSFALDRRIEGEVVVEATIAEDGSVSHARAIRGPSLLTEAAVEAVRRWSYRAAVLNGKPVATQTQITINFRLPK